jgi:hypothetical protein
MERRGVNGASNECRAGAEAIEDEDDHDDEDDLGEKSIQLLIFVLGSPAIASC